MQFLRFKLPAVRPVRLLIIAVVCSVLFFQNMLPAAAISSSPSDLRSGEVQLDEIYEKSEDALRREPRSMKELQSEASKGPNEVQGGADLNSRQMNRPENSEDATTAAEGVEKALKKLTNQD